jgi:long-chain acyl-CoA synthetase
VRGITPLERVAVLDFVAMMDTTRPWLRSYPEQVAWDAPLPTHPLDQLLDASVARFPDRPCLDFLGRKYTYREVGDLVGRAAAGLQAMGIGRGARVGLFLPNSPYYVILYFAVLKAGGTVVNFNPLYAEAELRHQIEDAGVEVMATLDLVALYPKLARLIGTTKLKTVIVCRMADALPFPKNRLFPLLRRQEVAPHPQDAAHIPFAMLVAQGAAPLPVAIDPQRDIAVLQYTGGTTGVPKGAMLTHANLVANAAQCALWFHQFEPGGERALAVLPFFHAFAMTAALNCSIATGAEIVLLPRFEIVQLLKTITRTKPTFFPGVPTIFTAINGRADLAKYDLSSIKFCIAGGAPLPLEVKQRFEALTGCVLVEGYGMTETSPVATCNPLAGLTKPGSIGLPLPGTTVEIVALDDPTRVLPVGEKGEITIAGPQVMAGYWRRPDETAKVMAAGRLRTGDVGIIDADGYVFLVDRIKDVILCGGYKVYPRLIEEAIYQHPEVLECLALGVPDAYRGETVKAFVVRRTGATMSSEALLAFLGDKLSPIEMPKQVEFRATLPKTAIGKLSRKALADEESARRATAEP